MKDFITQIITFILTALLTALASYVTCKIDINVISNVSLFVIIPLAFIYFVITLASLIPSITSGFQASFSDSLGIKITSIIILVLTAFLVVIDVYTALTLFGVI